MAHSSDESEDDAVWALYDEISLIQSAGHFATGERIQPFDNPGLQIDDSRLLSLPLSEEDAKYLIRLSQQAPFGKGSETIVDESIRKTWQIDANRVKFKNKRWQACLDRITLNTATRLGVAKPESVCAELYKMLIYEEGGKFHAHQDTEKSPGMFATLIICLPSPHNGGQVVLQHQEEKMTFATDKDSEFDASSIAWYSDVAHEVKEVKAGYRCVLSYNLIDTQEQTCSAENLSARVQSLVDVLDEWTGQGIQLYPLEHKYTVAGLKLNSLKGADYSRVAHVSQACARRGDFILLLANLELHVIDDQYEDDHAEVDEKLYVTRIVDLDGHDLTVYRERPVTVSRVLAPRHFKDRDPDAQSGGGYMGNQAGEIHQFYIDSVINPLPILLGAAAESLQVMVIVPYTSFTEFLVMNKATYVSYDTLFHRLYSRWNASDSAPHAAKGISIACWDLLHGRIPVAAGQDNLVLGAAAVATTWLQNAEGLRLALKKATGSFHSKTYGDFGEDIDLQAPLVPLLELAKFLSEHGSISTRFANIAFLQTGFLRGNADRNNPVQQQYLTSWLDSTRCLALFIAPAGEADAKDAQCLVKYLNGRQDRAFHQFVLYQSIRQFVSRASTNMAFIMPLLLQILKELDVISNPHQPLSSLFDHIIVPFSASFNLTTYLRNCAESDYGGFSWLIKSILQRGFGKEVSNIIGRAREQTLSLDSKQAEENLPCFLDGLLSNFDESFHQLFPCVPAALDAYALQFVNREPEQPSDWRRDAEMARCHEVGCETCSLINTFLQDPDEKECKIQPARYHSTSYYFPYLEIKSSAAGSQESKVVKTLKKWEEDHEKWKARLKAATKMIGKLPEGPLRQCLGDSYNEYLGLEMLKKANVEAAVTESVDTRVVRAPSPRTHSNSVVPQKRMRSAS